ncbi:MAG TPA: CRTAC1 family protein [Thermoanaerobaculia bacterium]|jgi:hypothetical protein
MRKLTRSGLAKTISAIYFLVTPLASAVAAAPADRPFFTDVAEATGLDFVHWNGMTGELYFVEMTGQGGAFLDYDGDGDLDVYLVQGAPLPGKPLAAFPGPGPPRDRLFRNDLDKGKGLAFVDVTAESGLDATGYGMGVAVGDVDNDGHVDLYVTNYGPNQLWRNRGDGTFEDVTAKSGTDDPRWSTSAAFFDFDADGWLDLYVVNYVDYRVEDKVVCYATSSRRDYCGPSSFQPVADKLLRNRGDGTFEEVTLRLLLGYRPGPGLGVVSGDFNGDRRLDLYVANDGAVNQLWLQTADAAFRDEALMAGVAVNRSGQSEASMGVDAGDGDGDGDLDLVLAHLMGETNTLYLNDGGALFTDRSVESGIASPSFGFTAFGAGWIDYDNDGWLDLLTVNGAVKILEELARQGDPYPLGQANQLFRNLGGRFEDVTARAGEAFARAEVSRGAAFGDVDDDGDVDVLVTNSNGRARLLVNQTGQDNPWVGLRLTDGRRDQLGATVRVERPGPPVLARRARTDGGYCSAHDPRVLIGLGAAAGPVTVRVDWPGGASEKWQKIPIDRYTTLRRGAGETVR